MLDQSEINSFDAGLNLAPLRVAETYWKRLLNTAQVPARSDLDPNALNEALPHVMVLERVSAGVARIRLAGQFVNRFCGMDVRGMPVSCLVAAEDRVTLSAHIEAAFSGPAIVEVPLSQPRGWGRGAVRGRLLILPMTDVHGDVTRALAVMIAECEDPRVGTIAFRLPRDGGYRCTMLPKVPGRVERPRYGERRAMPLPRVSKAAPEVRESRAANVPTVAEGPVPYLRLVVSNE